jgi:Lipopolysaccharide-assembly
MKRIYQAWIVIAMAALCALAGCEPGGHFTIPGLGYTTKPPFDETIRTVYVPIPLNASWMRDIEFDLEKAVLNELNMRSGAPRVTSNRNCADTELVIKIVNTTKSTILINQAGENRNAEIGIMIEVVWRDLRPGHLGDILSNRRRFDPQEKPLPGDPVATAPAAIPYLITPTAQYVPELGGSNNVANVTAARVAARQIVNMMEEWPR